MRKALWKKCTAVLMAVTMMFTMAGCGEKTEEQQMVNAVVDIEEFAYDDTEIAVEGIEGEVQSYVVKGDTCYIKTVQPAENEEGQDVCKLYKVNADGSDLQEISVDLLDGESVGTFLVGEDESLIYTIVSGESEEKVHISLIKLGADGMELLREDITNSLELGKDAGICNILADASGKVIVVCEQNVYILDENFQPAGKVAVDTEYHLLDAAVTKDGQIICVQEMFASAQSVVEARILDVGGKKWGETFSLDMLAYSGNDIVMDGLDYDFYYKDNSGIYGYDIAAKNGTMLLDCVASDLTSKDTDGMVARAEGKFLGVSYDCESAGTNIVEYTKYDPAANADKQVITYGCMWATDAVKRAAASFNKNNDNYRIELKEYMNVEDPETTLNAEIIAGKAPDVLDMSSLGSVELFTSKGLLEDLTPYYEKDAEIGTEELIPSVLESMKIDGKIYYVASSFMISSVIGRTKDVGNATGWTFDEMKALLEEKGEGVRPFNTENKTEMLDNFLMAGLDDFVNWQTGECSFNSQDFKDILEICNENGVDEEEEWDEAKFIDTSNQRREGKILLEAGDIAIDSVQMEKQIFGDDVTFIGYPNKDKQGSFFTFYNKLAMNSQSNAKDAAWDFIRIFMTKEYQGTVLTKDYAATPTRQDCFEMRMKAETTTEAYTDEFGQEIQPTEVYTYDVGGIEIKRGPLSQEDADMYVDLVNRTTKCGGADETMLEIVVEEAQKYFAGKKSLDKTVDVIQKRIETYVNEQR